jgi:hypothetical protein
MSVSCKINGIKGSKREKNKDKTKEEKRKIRNERCESGRK